MISVDMNHLVSCSWTLGSLLPGLLTVALDTVFIVVVAQSIDVSEREKKA